MGKYPSRIWVPGNKPITFGHEFVKAWEARQVIELAVWEERHFQPAFVLIVEWLEKLWGITTVDENWNTKLASSFPDNVEFGIIKLQPRSIRLPCCESKTLLNLTYTNGSVPNILSKLGSDARTGPWTHIF
jgi:hypothetical protein